ncbi:MAG: hypothetical protein ACR2RV_14640 [Verrucomicrobiales bacterium]
MISRLSSITAAVLLPTLLIASSSAENQTFQTVAVPPNFDSLNDTASWLSTTLPGSSDLAIFDNRTTNVFGVLESDLSIRGIKVLDPGSLNVTSGFGISATEQTIGETYVYNGALSIGAGGFDLSEAILTPGITNSFFTISAPITLTADQSWNIPRLSASLNRELSLSGSTFSSNRRTTPLDFGGHTATITGGGVVSLVFDRLLNNGTLIVDEGTAVIGNAINLTDTNIIQDVEDTFTVRVNGDGVALFHQPPTADRGKLNWNGNLVLNGGTAGLNLGGYRGNLTLDGTISAMAETSNRFAYNLENADPEPVTVTLAAPISGSGKITLANSSTRTQDRIVLAGNDSTYSGDITLSGGTFLANNDSGSASGTGSVTVDETTTLGGTGTIGDLILVDDSCSLHPGATTGDTETLRCTSATIPGGLMIDYDSTASDKLVVAGALDMTGASLTLIQGGDAAELPSYVLAEAVSISGFDGITTSGVPDGYVVELVTAGIGQQIQMNTGGTRDPFETWLAGFVGVDPDASEPGDDSDRDRLENAVEFVLNSNPASSLSENLPQLTISPGAPVFTYGRLRAANDAGYLSTVEWSTELNPSQWNEIAPEVTSSDGSIDSMNAAIPLPAGATRVFARLKVTLPNQ